MVELESISCPIKRREAGGGGGMVRGILNSDFLSRYSAAKETGPLFSLMAMQSEREKELTHLRGRILGRN